MPYDSVVRFILHKARSRSSITSRLNINRTAGYIPTIRDPFQNQRNPNSKNSSRVYLISQKKKKKKENGISQTKCSMYQKIGLPGESMLRETVVTASTLFLPIPHSSLSKCSNLVKTTCLLVSWTSPARKTSSRIA